MSFNRGNNRRDVGRRSNDFGGGANRRGLSSGNYNYGSYNSRPVNPWEGGIVPGRPGSAGLLSSGGQGDLLSQLTSPEAQLALASNLINKLITQQQQQVPPLLSLGNLGSGGGNMSSYGDGYGNSRNYQERRRGRMDQHRTEPYNKSGIIRRDHRYLGQNKNRMGSSSEYKTSFTKSSPKVQREDKKDAEKVNGDAKTESADDSKRGEGKGEDSKGEEGDKESTAKIPIPAPLLYCHICSKNMWDEVSFTNHLKGRPHEMMMNSMSEKYKLKVSLLRHETKVAEQQREMDLEKKQRQGRKMYNHPREYCAMCDLNFTGNLISHRKNARHQKLKSFLHPKCNHCNKEFSTRMEWDEHRLSFPHLEKVAEFRRLTKPNIKDDEFDIDELVNPENINVGAVPDKEMPVIKGSRVEEDLNLSIKESALKEKEDVKTDPKGEDEKADENLTDENKPKEDSKTVTAPQGLDCEPSDLPRYSSNIVIGSDLVKKVSGLMCQVCNCFIFGEEDASVHCRTFAHHTNFCNIIRTKSRLLGRKKKDKKGDKTLDEKDEDENEDEKADETLDDTSKTDDEGNWKRRKTNDVKEEKMEIDDSKNDEGESKDELSESVWEEVGKDVDAVFEEIQKNDSVEEAEEDQEDSKKETDPKNTSPATRGTSRGRRGGGKRGK